MKVVYHGEEREMEGPVRVRDMILVLTLDPGLVLAVRRGEILLLDDIAVDEDEVELIDAIAGG